MEMKLFTSLNNRQFGAAVRFFTSDKRKELVSKFWDYVANAVARTYETGDSTHANKAAAAAEICGYGPAFRKFAVPVIPFKYNRADKGFEGTIQKGKRNALDQLNDDGVITWEAELHRRINQDAEESKKPKAFDAKAVMLRCIKAEIKHGLAPADVRKLFNSCISEVAKPTAVATKKAA